MDYTSALALLNGRQSRKLENNTYLEMIRNADKPMIGVRLHSTHVVIFTPEWIELDSGGWHAKITAERMSSYSGYRVGEDKGTWRVWAFDRERGGWDWESGGYVYFDGIRLANDSMGMIDDQPNAPVGIMAPIVTERGGWGGSGY